MAKATRECDERGTSWLPYALYSGFCLDFLLVLSFCFDYPKSNIIVK